MRVKEVRGEKEKKKRRSRDAGFKAFGIIIRENLNL